MARYVYPVELAPDDNDTLLVTSPDFPELTTFGEDEADALRHAVDALRTVVDHYIESDRPLPDPSPARGRPTVALPALVAAKAALYSAMRESSVTQTELARRLGIDGRQVRRLLDLYTSTRFGELERALAAVGRRLTVTIEKAA